MIVLGIETSCDETAISLIDADVTLTNADNPRKSAFTSAKIRVLADKTLSQIELHKHYGGVFPNMAKREHGRNLIPLFKTVLTESGLLKAGRHSYADVLENISIAMEREKELFEQFSAFIPTIKRPPIDAIAVTEGPGLEPCLWTGINFAKVLSLVWDIPVIPVNHMEGHIFSALLRAEENPNNQSPNPKQASNSNFQFSKKKPTRYQLSAMSLPALALLISGGHTELVLIKKQFDYKVIGETRDDAVGEAFDKVARLLSLPYPGGPEISKLAERAREKPDTRCLKSPTLGVRFPRPMIHSGDFDFSFSGLKTAVLYLLKKIGEPDEKTKAAIAREFEDAVTEVLIAKTKKAIETYGAEVLLIGGGVIANTHIRRAFESLGGELGIPVFIPEKELATDNALMIAVAGLMHAAAKKTTPSEPLKALGNLRLGDKI